ncbi:IS1-like element transposase [Xenorhabdus indica]
MDMAINNSSIRDTAWVLKVGINTVIRTLKSSRQEMRPICPDLGIDSG